MLKEILGLADDPPARRRWFHDDDFDLFVWQAEGELTLFELRYGADSVTARRKRFRRAAWQR